MKFTSLYLSCVRTGYFCLWIPFLQLVFFPLVLRFSTLTRRFNPYNSLNLRRIVWLKFPVSFENLSLSHFILFILKAMQYWKVCELAAACAYFDSLFVQCIMCLFSFLSPFGSIFSLCLSGKEPFFKYRWSISLALNMFWNNATKLSWFRITDGWIMTRRLGARDMATQGCDIPAELCSLKRYEWLGLRE